MNELGELALLLEMGGEKDRETDSPVDLPSNSANTTREEGCGGCEQRDGRSAGSLYMQVVFFVHYLA